MMAKIEQINGKFYGKTVYEHLYNPDKDEYICTCDAFTFKKKCCHLKKFAAMIEQSKMDMIKDQEIFA